MISSQQFSIQRVSLLQYQVKDEILYSQFSIDYSKCLCNAVICSIRINNLNLRNSQYSFELDGHGWYEREGKRMEGDLYITYTIDSSCSFLHKSSWSIHVILIILVLYAFCVNDLFSWLSYMFVHCIRWKRRTLLYLTQ